MDESNDVSVVGTEAPDDEQISVVGQAEQDAPEGEPEGNAPEKEDAAPGKDAVADAKEPAPAVPEAYKFEMPEGFELNETALEEITPVLKELKLTQEQAQKLADWHFAQLKSMEDAQVKARASVIDQWTRELKADREIGGPDLKANLLYGTRLLNRFGSADLDSLLQQSGLDRNPVMVRFLVAVGKEFAEDRWADGGKHGPAVMGPGEVAKQLFDKTL